MVEIAVAAPSQVLKTADRISSRGSHHHPITHRPLSLSLVILFHVYHPKYFPPLSRLLLFLFSLSTQLDGDVISYLAQVRCSAVVVSLSSHPTRDDRTHGGIKISVPGVGP